MTLVAFVSSYLLCAVLLLKWVKPRAWPISAAILLLVLGAMFLPVAGGNVIGVLASFFGELSAISLLLLLQASARALALSPAIPQREFRAFMALIAVFGSALYLLSLTPASVDLYAQGYAYTTQSSLVFAGFALTGAVAWYQRGYWLLGALCLAVLLFTLGAYRSDNFFDTLIDAPLYLYSLWFCLRSVITRARK